MSKCLSIAIPTYNRASLLAEQLQWVANATVGLEGKLELIISDNCSTDQTAEVIQAWLLTPRSLEIRHVRQPENQGAIRNIAYCITVATADYVWVVSDDDTLDLTTVQKVVHTLHQHPDLGMIMLNYACYSADTGELAYPRRYSLEQDEWNPDGKAFFEKYLEIDYGGLVLTTALVYRTALAQAAIAAWEAGMASIMFQLYITAVCARGGSAFLTQEPLIRWMSGRAFFSKNIDLFIQTQLSDLQTIYVNLAMLGYSQRLCRRLVMRRVGSREWLLLAVKLLLKYPLRASLALMHTGQALGRLWFTILA
jgi:abequosyltransferase